MFILIYNLAVWSKRPLSPSQLLIASLSLPPPHSQLLCKERDRQVFFSLGHSEAIVWLLLT